MKYNTRDGKEGIRVRARENKIRAVGRKGKKLEERKVKNMEKWNRFSTIN